MENSQCTNPVNTVTHHYYKRNILWVLYRSQLCATLEHGPGVDYGWLLGSLTSGDMLMANLRCVRFLAPIVMVVISILSKNTGLKVLAIH